MGGNEGQLSSESLAEELCLPMEVAQPSLVAYRSVGIGVFGAVMRFVGMPLEKIALFMNSSQVSGSNQFGQAVRLTFADGALTPFRVVGPSSLTAWFLQYSVMSVAYQSCDQALSTLIGVRPMYYGRELMEAGTGNDDEKEPATFDYQVRSSVKTLVAPILAATLESFVSNRAEVQRFFGPGKFGEIEAKLNVNVLRRAGGPAFIANVTRNTIMCNTSFIITPMTYKFLYPQELKSQSSLFWYGLGVNMFVGNVVAITQQALWGRSLDYLLKHGNINYQAVIRDGFQKEGASAFFTVPKWFSRVLMNAPAQGTLPWFYNEVLPWGERYFLGTVKRLVYEPFLKTSIPFQKVKRRRTALGSLPTANREIAEGGER